MYSKGRNSYKLKKNILSLDASLGQIFYHEKVNLNKTSLKRRKDQTREVKTEKQRKIKLQSSKKYKENKYKNKHIRSIKMGTNSILKHKNPIEYRLKENKAKLN